MPKITIMSEDPEVQKLTGYIYGLQHFDNKGFSADHLKVICTVKMLCLVMHGKGYPRRREIAGQLGVEEEDIETELMELVEHGFIHEQIPNFGPLTNTTYRMAAKGGTMMKKVLTG